jgi:hypothetical protein
MAMNDLKKLHRRELLAALGAGVGAAALAASETAGPYPDITGMINNPRFSAAT